MSEPGELSRSFGAAAGAYESGRPDYPREAVDWMLEPARADGRALRVADVGAGTGKLTRTVVETGADVVAIDPDPDMLAALRRAVHGVPTFAGTAERMPLPDASLDAVVVGQAWHWVDPDPGTTEAARVLRSGGVLGLIWNIRDESEPWVGRLTEIMQASHAELMLARGGPSVGRPFDGLQKRTWRWTRHMSRAALLDMVASRSPVIAASEAVRARILTEVGELFDAESHPGSDGGGVLAVPYRTEAFRARRP